MKSFNGDVKLKADLIEEMQMHQEADDLIKGTYAKQNGRFRGCAVGCSVQSLIVRRGVKIAHDDHKALGEATGTPEWLMRLQDTLFENLPDKERREFPVKFWRAIPEGVDLKSVKWKFCAYLMRENIDRVLALKDIDDALKEKVVTAIRGVLSLHEKAAETGEWDESAARSAESAAWSAARSAESAARSARSAAWSAWSAAWSAARSAESAARSAAFIKHSEKLLELLRDSK